MGKNNKLVTKNCKMFQKMKTQIKKIYNIYKMLIQM